MQRRATDSTAAQLEGSAAVELRRNTVFAENSKQMTQSIRQYSPESMRTWKIFAMVSAVVVRAMTLAADDFQGATHITPFDEDTIAYSKTEAVGPVPRLQKQIDKGEARLKFDPEHGFLLALLREFKIDTNSQMLVFSKTSFQRERISPKNPRAIYFNDHAYVGYVKGSPMLEVTSVDPRLGAIFYTLDQEPGARPQFRRNDQCLECHASTKSMGVPGHLIRSFACDEDGVVDLNKGTSLVTHRTPLLDRWGGWYVTGSSGNQAHRGNLIGKAAYERLENSGKGAGNIANLDQFFAVDEYPAATSDIVALMVLEHQSHMHNYITRLHYDARLALQQCGHLNYMKSKIESFLRYMLFTEETSLSAPVRGNTEFARNFCAIGPKDKQGRSLRDFDLQTRLFKYPCSYLIYSEAFESLPPQLKEVIYQRLWDILNGKETTPEFRSIPAGSRAAIREILTQTKSGLPSYWH
jgi:hypothetical protein